MKSCRKPYRELIAEALTRGRNAMAIWQDLVDDHGFTARYASIRRFVVSLRGTTVPEARNKHREGTEFTRLVLYWTCRLGDYARQIGTVSRHPTRSPHPSTANAT